MKRSIVLLALLAAPALQAEPGNFDAIDFGAKGDGVADDAPAIQKAINAAAAKPGGGNVVFPKGTYLLDSASPSSHPWVITSSPCSRQTTRETCAPRIRRWSLCARCCSLFSRIETLP